MRQWRRAITTTQNAFSSIVLMSGNLKEMKSALAENCLFSGALFAFKNFIFPFVFFHQIFTITPFLIASRTSTFSSLFSTFTHWIVFIVELTFFILFRFSKKVLFLRETRDFGDANCSSFLINIFLHSQFNFVNVFTVYCT